MHSVVKEDSPLSSMSKVTPECNETSAVQKRLMNGDLYIGAFSDHSPHGFGTYQWRDGCVYEGVWKNGTPSGKGKFTWPSGACFHGKLRAGKMEGIGTFTGSTGDVYHGGWNGDLKNGYGVKLYANGDRYEGWWRRDKRDGKGKYVWGNGNVYEGNWRNGVISGKGALIWANGNRYEGEWDNGAPKNVGVLEVGGRFQKICIWEREGENGDITCDLVDRKFKKPPCCFNGGDQAKKQGETISKGHKNYELMLHLQLGIRCSVSKHEHLQRNLKASDFDPREKSWTRFPSEGSKTTPSHQSCDFWMKDYCPMVFRRLRELFQIDTADYMVAICGNEALREFSSPGKSGSFFYLTQDDRFMIKTVKKSEVKVLIRMLHSYYHHVSRFEHSLVTKFFGVHCIKPVGGPKTRFIVMGNLFCSEYRIHRRFDLKGSSHGRSAEKPESEGDETMTLKDNDLNIVFKLGRIWFSKLKKQIDRDCEFLEREKIMDYSLLVGVHFGGGGGCGGGTRVMRLGVDVPARSAPMGRKGADCEVVLCFGIIDFLQDYDISKKIEHVYKSLHADASSISAVDPKMYSRRFRNFVGRIFFEDNRQ